MRRAELGRPLLYLALLWPLVFLFVPPRGSSSRMALLSAGMDVVDPDSLSRHLLGTSRKKMTAKDRIDDLRRIVSGKVKAEERIPRDGMRSLLGRTDAVGYGPSMPRFAAVIVVPPPPSSSEGGGWSDDDLDEERERRLLDGAARAVESIFRTSDRNRVFVVAVVMDGRVNVRTTAAGAGKEFEARLRDVDSGRTAHRHGNRAHVHHDEEKEEGVEEDGSRGGGKEEEKEKEKEEEHSHSTKVHVIYNRKSLGVSASRDAGTRFVNALVREHEGAGLKSAEEELILLFLRCDSTLREFPPMGGGEGPGEENGSGGGGVGGRTWLDDVTDALIPTPDDYSKTNDDAAPGGGVTEVRRPPPVSPPANAVSFVVDHSAVDVSTGNVVVRPSNLGATFSFDRSLRIVRSHASGQDMALSDGASYPAPLSTAATAMRLNTYNALPAPCDAMLSNHHAADVQLSLNLWMCADGIDVLGGGMARVVVDPTVLGESDRGELSGPLAARKFTYLRKCVWGGIALKNSACHTCCIHSSFFFIQKKVSSARGCRATRTRPTPMAYCTP